MGHNIPGIGVALMRLKHPILGTVYIGPESDYRYAWTYGPCGYKQHPKMTPLQIRDRFVRNGWRIAAAREA